MRKKQTTKRLGFDSYAFVVDGETEKWYLELLRKHEPSLRVRFKPELNTKNSIDTQYKYLLELSPSHSKVFWVIDLDVIIKESNEVAKGKKKPIAQLQECLHKLYSQKKKGKLSNVFVIINTPCLEYWILLHKKKTSAYYATCDKVIKEIQKHSDFSDYEKSEKYYKSTNNDIYKKLRPFLQTALKNASSLSPFNIEDYEKGLSEMHILFQELGLCDDEFVLNT